MLSLQSAVGLIPFFAEGAEEGFVADDGVEGFEGTDIALGVEPEAHVTAFGVFRLEYDESQD